MPKKEKIIDVPGKMIRCLKILFWKILPMEGESIEHGYVQTKGKVIKELPCG